MDLVLASTSPTRALVLRQRGVQFRALSPTVDESAICADDPSWVALERARAKARSVARRAPSSVVVGADQVVYDPTCPSEHWGKPRDPAAALARLRACVGRSHVLLTGMVVWSGGRETSTTVSTVMHVRPDLTDAELQAYVRTGEGLGCAGGYAAEGRGAFLFDRIEGDWTNVLGLPFAALMSELREHGWRADSAWEAP